MTFDKAASGQSIIQLGGAVHGGQGMQPEPAVEAQGDDAAQRVANPLAGAAASASAGTSAGTTSSGIAADSGWQQQQQLAIERWEGEPTGADGGEEDGEEA